MSETVTLTLTDFLLARIAEDELSVGVKWGPEFSLEYAYVEPRRDRVVAECEAKRRIVAIHGGGGIDCDFGANECITLRALALPYADHPDYREEWRE